MSETYGELSRPSSFMYTHKASRYNPVLYVRTKSFVYSQSLSPMVSLTYPALSSNTYIVWFRLQSGLQHIIRWTSDSLVGFTAFVGRPSSDGVVSDCSDRNDCRSVGAHPECAGKESLPIRRNIAQQGKEQFNRSRTPR